MLSLASLLFLQALAGDPAAEAAGRVEVMGAPPAFALEPGFVEVVPDTALAALVFDAAEDDELIVELVRLGPLGRGRAKATVSIGAAKRALTVLAPTVADRPVGGSFASLPVRQRVPLPTGRSKIELRVDAPMGIRLGIGKQQAPAAIALVPLTGGPLLPVVEPASNAPADAASDAPVASEAPAAPELVYPAAPAVAEEPPVPVTTVAPRVTVLPPPAPPPAPPARPFPRVLAELHAGTSMAFGGLQDFVPGGGARLLVGPRNLDAALGFALDFDGQSAFVGAGGGHWDVASTRLRMDGHLGLGDLAVLDARFGLTVGAGARFAEHHASLTGVRRTVVVIGVTARAAPEVSVPAGPGRFVVMLPLDVTFDMPARVRGFTPVAAGVFLGYRLEL